MDKKPKKREIAYCGIICSSCPAYRSARKPRPRAQIRVARLWSTKENQYEACDITCKGCTEAWGRKFSHCINCKVRECARKRQIRHCGECDEYPCQKLKDLYDRLDPRIKRIKLTRSGSGVEKSKSQKVLKSRKVYKSPG